MIPTDDAKFFLKKFQLMSGLSLKVCKDVFETFISVIVTDYLADDESHIPFFGTFKFKFKGTEDSPKGAITLMDVDFEPDSYFARQVGLVADKKETDIEKHLREKIQRQLKKAL